MSELPRKRGRPKGTTKPEQRKVPLATSITPEQRAALDDLRERLGVTVSQVIAAGIKVLSKLKKRTKTKEGT